MPFGDRTGRFGMGPLTGRRMGYCAGYPQPGYVTQRGPGMGFGQGRGRGRGFGYGMGMNYGYHPGVESAFDEKALLEQRSELLEKEIVAIKERLKALDKE